MAAARFARVRIVGRSQPMIRPGKPFFLSANPSEPPMRPVPMIVIWRIEED